MSINGDGYDREGIRQAVRKPIDTGTKVAGILVILVLGIPLVLAWVGLVRFLLEWAF